MSQFDSNKDYYGVLGVDKDASRGEIDRQYKRQAAKHHPDRGGSEERMKSLNEAYGILKDKTLRTDYDAKRRRPATYPGYTRVTTPTARDVGVLGDLRFHHWAGTRAVFAVPPRCREMPRSVGPSDPRRSAPPSLFEEGASAEGLGRNRAARTMEVGFE